MGDFFHEIPHVILTTSTKLVNPGLLVIFFSSLISNGVNIKPKPVIIGLHRSTVSSITYGTACCCKINVSSIRFYINKD